MKVDSLSRKPNDNFYAKIVEYEIKPEVVCAHIVNGIRIIVKK